MSPRTTGGFKRILSAVVGGDGAEIGLAVASVLFCYCLPARLLWLLLPSSACLPKPAHLPLPASPACAYPGFGVHTFKLLNKSGKETLVKFHWIPKEGESRPRAGRPEACGGGGVPLDAIEPTLDGKALQPILAVKALGCHSICTSGQS